jgi:hypothetical protein
MIDPFLFLNSKLLLVKLLQQLQTSIGISQPKIIVLFRVMDTGKHLIHF